MTEALETSPGNLSRYNHVTTQLRNTILSISSVNGNAVTTSDQGSILSSRRLIKYRRRLIAKNLIDARRGKRFGAKQP